MPDPPRLVVTNTTPLIALALIGKLHLSSGLYGEVLVPPTVYAEAIARVAQHQWIVSQLPPSQP